MYRYLSVLLCLSYSWLVSASELVNFASRYQSPVSYEVFRDGKPVGQYQIRFTYPSEFEVKVDVDMNLSLSIFGLFKYEYQYAGTEHWQDDRLAEVDIVINKDGDLEQISALRQDNTLIVKEGDEAPKTFNANVLTTHHWYPGILKQRQVFNTLTGEISDIEVNQERLAAWRIGERELKVTGYRLGGDLKDTLSWYDDQGIWRGMQFSAGDGSTIEVRWRGAEVIDDRAG